MKKNILYLEHCIDNTVGGSHYCLLEICRTIDRDKYNLIVAFYQSNDLLDEFRKTGVQVEILKPHRPFISPSYIPWILGKLISRPVNVIKMLLFRVMYWRQILRRYNVDILHLNNTFTTDHDAILAARSRNITCLAHVRGIQPNINSFSRILTHLLVGIVSISDAVTDNLIKNNINKEKIIRIYDGIDPHRMKRSIGKIEVRNKYQIPDTARVIGIIGNVKPWKGQQVVVEAMLKLAGDYTDLYCFLVGAIADQNYCKQLQTIVDGAGLSERVLIVGYQRNVADFINSFDVFIHASIDPEPFGIVILEAMSLRKPVIVSNIGAPKEIIVDGISGLLFESGNPDDLARVLKNLLDNTAERNRLGVQGDERLQRHFTSEINAAALMRLYAQFAST